MGKKSKRQRPNSNRQRKGAQADQTVVTIPIVDPRTKANQLKREFLELSAQEGCKWDVRRIEVLHQYKKLMSETLNKDNFNAVNFATKEDISFLRAIAKKQTELTYIRANALYSFSYLCDKNMEQEDASQGYGMVIKLCREANDLEKLQMYGPQTMAAHLDLLEEGGQKCLQIYRDCGIIPLDGTQREVPVFGGGQQCGTCLKIVEDIASTPLRCCGRCQLTYYCSRECQKKGWKLGGHKLSCRKKGEFCIGDFVQCVDPDGVIPFGNSAQILAPVPKQGKKKPKKWLVLDPTYDGKKAFVLTKNLRRIPPLIWDMCTGKQKHEEVLGELKEKMP